MNCPLKSYIPYLICLLVTTGSYAQEKPVFNLNTFISQGLEKDGYLIEKRYGKKLKENAIDRIKMGAILPRFEVTAGWGPAPGLKNSDETSYYTSGIMDGNQYDSLSLITTKTEYDWTSISKWGPAFVTELKMVQPLNVFRYNSGVAAAEADQKMYDWQTKSLELKKVRELQEYYYGYLYAYEMHKLALEVEREMEKIEEKLEELLDDDDESVSQFDLLELKTNGYSISNGVEESNLGLTRAKLAATFSLGYNATHEFSFADTVLVERTDVIPHVDSLKNVLIRQHPDLKQLHYGLKAKKALVALSAGELGPEIFITAGANYAKSWAGDRRSSSNEVFSEDPLNKVSGAVGIGVKYSLNVWSKLESYRKRKLEFTHLRRKEDYAERGLLLLLEEQYGKYEKAQRLLKSARKSMRAAEAWFKGAAMKYDVDPSESRALLTAFKAKVKAKQMFVKSVYTYNIEIARLYEKCGWSMVNNNSSFGQNGDL